MVFPDDALGERFSRIQRRVEQFVQSVGYLRREGALGERERESQADERDVGVVDGGKRGVFSQVFAQPDEVGCYGPHIAAGDRTGESGGESSRLQAFYGDASEGEQ